MNISKGSKTGEIIKVAGGGDYDNNYTEPGDLIIKINIINEENIERIDDNIIYKMDISLIDSLCGFKFKYNHLNNRELLIESNKPLKIGQDMTLKGYGFPIKNTDSFVGFLLILYMEIKKFKPGKKIWQRSISK